MGGHDLMQAVLEVVLVVEDIIEDLFVLHGPHVGHGDGGSDRMAAKRRSVIEEAGLGVPHGLDQRASNHHAAKWLIGTGHALREGDHVWYNTETFTTGEVAQTTECIDDLVGAQQDPVLVAQPAQFLPITSGWHYTATSVLHRLSDNQRNGLGALGQDPCLDGLDACKVSGGSAFRNLIVAGIHDMVHAVPHHGGKDFFEFGDAGHGQSAQGGAVIGPLARDDLVTARVALAHVIVTSKLEGRLDCFGT